MVKMENGRALRYGIYHRRAGRRYKSNLRSRISPHSLCHYVQVFFLSQRKLSKSTIIALIRSTWHKIRDVEAITQGGPWERGGHTTRFDWEFISLCRVNFQYDAIDFYRLAASVVGTAYDIGQYYAPLW